MIPTLSELVSTLIIPSFNTELTVPSKWKLEANRPPTTIPIKRELYTSFVINARPIATIGGTSAQKVAYIAGCTVSPSEANTVSDHMDTIISTATSPFRIVFFCFMFLSPFFLSFAAANTITGSAKRHIPGL